MKHSADRILTTDAGSLPRPPDLLDLLQSGDPAALDRGTMPGGYALYQRTKETDQGLIELAKCGPTVRRLGPLGDLSVKLALPSVCEWRRARHVHHSNIDELIL